MRRVIVILMLLLCTVPAFAESTFAGRVLEIQREGAGVRCLLDNGRFEVRVLAANLVRVRFTPREKFDERPSHTVVEPTAAGASG